ncbi:Nahoda-like protein precursor [Saccoglossus kowalevskii]|uniref:Nahoda-like protein n=1 Tax=Saccoglossus kowalevskii TaxID=10224 RepID=D2XNH5_SACKO|nr:Nahoda-like protein precursor [Saccoglossus kowalevskii]ADB22605.1 Nahoda-like protein [Saccoglossus kowalevskii]
MNLVALVLYFAVLIDTFVESHVKLTYPPARHYEFDFLDDVSTLPPCGMRSDAESPVTTFEKGQVINVTWFLSVAYAHEGGYKIELLDGDTIHALSPVDAFILSEDSTREYYEVTLPDDVTCDKCTIRIIRQALEYKNGIGKNFWTCADISIQDNAQCDCSGHGACSEDTCTCDGLYYGDDCQYQDECDSDDDCNNGRCWNVQSSPIFRKQCFCEPGYHGDKCTQENPAGFSAEIDDSEYYHLQLSELADLYWKIIEDSSEIEVALKVQGQSWIALGWKPTDLTHECMNIPLGYDGYEDRDAEGKRKRREEERPLKGMECADMVIGMAVEGTHHRIGDFYSRDLATPNTDQWFGGTYELTAAIAKQENYITTVKFRKPLQANEVYDHSIVNEDMAVIWSRGQEVGSYHPPPANHEPNKEFYKIDELRWHGHDTSQRGAVVMNFYVDPDDLLSGLCQGEWKTPTDCAGDACEYSVTWSYDDVSDDVTFEIITSNGGNNKWTGIGFSLDKHMPKSDVVIGWVGDDGSGNTTSVYIYDGWIDSYSGGAVVDDSEHVTLKTGIVVDGMTTVAFKRKRNTGDEQDVALDGTGDDCAYFFYVVNGGGFDSVTNTISKHAHTPVVSSQRVCVNKCEAQPISGAPPMVAIGSNVLVFISTFLMNYHFVHE